MNTLTAMKPLHPSHSSLPSGVVEIVYEPSTDVFYSKQERIELSATYLLDRLNWRAEEMRVYTSPLGCLTIRFAGISCTVTKRAVDHLAHVYYSTPAHQAAFPWCGELFEVAL